LLPLSDQVVGLGYAASCSYELIRRLLKNTLKPWQKQEWCIPGASAEFVAAMERVRFDDDLRAQTGISPRGDY